MASTVSYSPHPPLDRIMFGVAVGFGMVLELFLLDAIGIPRLERLVITIGVVGTIAQKADKLMMTWCSIMGLIWGTFLVFLLTLLLPFILDNLTRIYDRTIGPLPIS